MSTPKLEGQAKPPKIPDIITDGRTYCVHCDSKWQKRVPIVGQPAEVQFFNFVGELAKHLAVKHPAVYARAFGMSAQFSELPYLDHFRSGDDDLAQHRDMIRAMIHQYTRKVSVSDETIADKVAELELPHPDYVQSVTALLTEFRNVMEERGLYSEPHEVPVQVPVNPAVPSGHPKLILG